MATPPIPQRPARSKNLAAQMAHMDVPQVPPRPRRSNDRSVSPNRDTYARSPLNDPSFYSNGTLLGQTQLRKTTSREAIPRPPSVDNFPSVGHEGDEYAALRADEEASGAIDPPITTNKAEDLPLHAPKASLPASTAKSRIAAVTRTDSQQAALIGIGKPISEDNFGHTLTRSESSQPSRPASLYSKEIQHEGDEQGIPEIGLQIPLLPNAGDVQAPTPSPSIQTPGLQQGGNGGLPLGRHHSRTKSGREIFHGPPGSYGLHGHGIVGSDPLEKAWYQKHPDQLAREAQGEYGPAIQENRKEWALSSEELNKLVHAKHMVAVGASTRVVGTPDEQIGYIASEEYAHRITSPRPASAQVGHAHRASSQVHAESPLRETSFPAHEAQEAIAVAGSEAHAVDSEPEQDEDVIHIDPPSRSQSRAGVRGLDQSAEDLGLHGGSTEAGRGFVAEGDYNVPILAADEVLLHPEAQYMQPAVDPHAETASEPPPANHSGLRRSGSRPSSIGAAPMHFARFAASEERLDSNTPLEDVKEYEPLFPDDEDGKKKALAEQLKRPDLARHHFPSQDIWEDTPTSLMYETTVKTPQLPDDSIRAAEHEPKEIFETPESEEARKSTITQEDQTNFLPDSTKTLAKTKLGTDILSDMPTRADGTSLQRFPSRDIWEDTPDHLLHTAVITPEPTQDETSPIESKAPPPQIPARPARSKAGQQVPTAETAISPPDDKKAPVVPERPKPSVPARPARPSKPASKPEDDGAPLAKSLSAEKAAPPVKAKPTIPARPVGGKIAALQAGFMKDLNQRLQIGPQAPKKEEPAPAAEEEQLKAPLADARKGRAKGPSRRKPGVSPTPAAAEEIPASKKVTFEFSQIVTIWEVNHGAVVVPSEAVAKEPPTTESVATEAAEPEPKTTEPKASEPVANSAEVTEPVAPEAVSAEISPASKMEPAHMNSDKPTATVEETQQQEVHHTPDNAEGLPADASVAKQADVPTTATMESAEKKNNDAAIQTGQTDITIDNGKGELARFTVYLGGRADKPGSVLVDAEGREHVADANVLDSVEKMGEGL